MSVRCSDCSETFPKLGTLTKHAEATGHKPFRCGEDVCRISPGSDGPYLAFKSQPMLSKHIDKVHGNRTKLVGGAFRCPECNVGFLGEYPLLDHFKCKHKTSTIHICRVCPRTFMSFEEVRDHMDISHQTPDSTPSHDANLEAREPIVSTAAPEILSHGSSSIPADIQASPCSSCPAQIIGRGYLDEHFMRSHPWPQCYMCAAPLDDVDGLPSSLDAHMARRHRCPLCKLDFEKLPLHHSLTHPDLLCKHCGKISSSSSQMREHYRREHPSRVEECPLCHSAGRTGKECPTHFDDEDTAHSAELTMDDDATRVAETASLPTGLGPSIGSGSDDPVPELLPSPFLLTRRQDSTCRLSQSPPTQEDCADKPSIELIKQPLPAAGSQVLSSGSDKGLLSVGRHETDAGSASYLEVSASTSTPPTSFTSDGDFTPIDITSLRCMDCGEAFATPNDLTKHGKSRAHMPFRCGHCKVSDGQRLDSFATHEELLRHSQMFHRRAANVWKCPGCPGISKRFSTEADLVQHFKAKHADKVLRLCHLCADGFLTVHALRAHVVGAHPGRAPHIVRQCHVCHVVIDNDEDDLQGTMDLHVALHHRCPVCDKDCRMLPMHYRLAHPDLMCKHCGKLFTSSTETTAHYQHEHPCQKETCVFCRTAVQTGKDCLLHNLPSDLTSSSTPRLGTPTAIEGVAETGSSLEEAAPNVHTSTNSFSDGPVAASAPAALELEHEELRTQPGAGAAETADGLQCEEHQGGLTGSSEADTAQAEDAPTAEHASAVSSDWERISSLAVSDCSDLSFEMASSDCSDLSSEVASVRSNSPAPSMAVRSECPQPEEQPPTEAAAAFGEDNASSVIAAAVPNVEDEDKDSSGADRASSSEDLQKVIAPPAPPTADQVSQPPTASEGFAESQVQPATTQPVTTQPVLACKSCAKSPTEPVVTMCGHVFCHGCILNALATTLSCPACNHPIFVRLNL